MTIACCFAERMLFGFYWILFFHSLHFCWQCCHHVFIVYIRRRCFALIPYRSTLYLQKRLSGVGRTSYKNNHLLISFDIDYVLESHKCCLLGKFYSNFEIICCFPYCATYGTREDGWELLKNRYRVSLIHWLVIFVAKLPKFWFCDKQLKVEITWRFQHMIISMIIINYSLWKHKVVHFAASLMRAKVFDLIFCCHMGNFIAQMTTALKLTRHVLVFNIYFN